MAQPEASQRLWFRYKPLGYCQARLKLRLSQRQERLPPLHAPIPTNMVVSASVASVLVRFARCYSRRHRSTSGLLVRTNCVHRAHHVQRGARDGHGLLIAALTALVRAPFGRGSEGLRYLPCGAVAADLEQMAQPEASQRLWF